MKKSDNEIWVFLSHSNKDYEKVKSVRDKLERDEFRPIMFFLKCLDDHEEIDDLIKREIDARTWFVLCNSKNARTSSWVQREIAYIKSTNRNFKIVDIDKSEKVIEKQLKELFMRMNIFISYSRQDESFVRLLNKHLMTNDFRTWMDTLDLQAGVSFQDMLISAIDNAANNGYIIFVISEQSLKSKWVREEVSYALSKDACIIPILLCSLDEVQSNEWIMKILNNRLHLCQNGENKDKFAKRVAEAIKNYDQERFNK